MTRKVYEVLAQLVCAMQTCAARGDNNMAAHDHQEQAEALVEYTAPSGSGFDNGTSIDIDSCHDGALVFETSYHHMVEGYYDRWTSHTVKVKASLSCCIDVQVSGKNYKDIKSYIAEDFDAWLRMDVEWNGEAWVPVAQPKEQPKSPSDVVLSFKKNGIEGDDMYTVGWNSALNTAAEAL